MVVVEQLPTISCIAEINIVNRSVDLVTTAIMWMSAAAATATATPSSVANVGDEIAALSATIPWLVLGAVAGTVRIAVLLAPTTAIADRPTWRRCVAILISAPFVATVVGIFATYLNVESAGRIILVLAGGYQSERFLRSYDTIAAALEANAPNTVAKWIEQRLAGNKKRDNDV